MENNTINSKEYSKTVWATVILFFLLFFGDLKKGPDKLFHSNNKSANKQMDQSSFQNNQESEDYSFKIIIKI